MAARLEERWRALVVVGLGLEAPTAALWWGRICARYGEPHRAYHTLQHLHSMFLLHDELCDELHDPMVVALAVFFHDVIYEPTAGDNEEQSAEMFREFAAEVAAEATGGGAARGNDKRGGLSAARAQNVCDMILLTKKHTTAAHLDTGTYGALDEHYMLDFDMAVLGCDWAQYQQYGRKIRAEYRHIPWTLYQRGRPAVLQGFLDTANIFATRPLRKRLEVRARSNLQREIVELLEAVDEVEWMGGATVIDEGRS